MSCWEAGYAERPEDEREQQGWAESDDTQADGWKGEDAPDADDWKREDEDDEEPDSLSDDDDEYWPEESAGPEYWFWKRRRDTEGGDDGA